MAKTTLATEWARQGFKDFAIDDLVSAPFTQIQNRARISNALKPLMGTERIRLDGVQTLQNEFGPNGELVWEPLNKDSRVRFVGTGWTNSNPEYGLPINSGQTNDFIEITFYGTGLSLIIHNNNASYDWRVTVDGGSESANVYTGGASYSNVLGGLRYKANSTFQITSGLVLGWHTVKVRLATGGMMLFGVEIMNQGSDLIIASGSAYSGFSKESLASAASSSYNAGIVGTRGARVVKYIKDGVISQAVQEVNATQQNLTAADHSNEEIIRMIQWREFGVQQSPDFSTLAGSSNRAFTLDDGVTTLIGNGATSIDGLSNGFYNGDILRPGGNGDGGYVTLVFVGTGLDVVRQEESSSGSSTTSVTVDGVNVGNLNTSNSVASRVEKLVSGLPYGTHTVRLTRTAVVSFNMGLTHFVIYGPKKPAIPAGASEIADYNVLANFSANTTSGSLTVAQGVIRKTNQRNFIYFQTWSAFGVDIQSTSGFFIQGQTNGGYLEHTFYGTGFEHRMNQPSSTATAQFSLNGTNLTSTNFPTATFSTYGAGQSFAASTGILSCSNTGGYGQGFRCSGLPLGKYTLRVALTNTAGWNFESLDVITPIHSNAPGFRVGALSLKDSRNSKPIPLAQSGVDLSKAKAWIQYSKVTGGIQIYSSHNIAAAIDMGSSIVTIIFQKPFKSANHYVAAGLAHDNGTNTLLLARSGDNTQQPRADRFTVNTVNFSQSGVDPERAYVVFFGELENEENS